MSADTLPEIGLAHRDRCIIVDQRALDVTDFLDRHPGGRAVLLAHLGGDASAEFHHVAAHSSPAVLRYLDRLTVASVRDTEAESTTHLRLVRNAFEVQLGVPREPLLGTVYLGQSYYHLLRYQLGELASGHDEGLAHVTAELFKRLVDRMIHTSDTALALWIGRWLATSVPCLFAQLADGATTGSWLRAERRRWSVELA